ncbi:hypothetical protein Tco_0466912, partial [Tanacetum coccineum]
FAISYGILPVRLFPERSRIRRALKLEMVLGEPIWESSLQFVLT